MKASGIMNLPAKFNFKSNINTVCSDVVYMAEQVKGGYKVTWLPSGLETYTEHEMHRCLLNNEFEVLN